MKNTRQTILNSLILRRGFMGCRELAKLIGVHPETLRHWSRTGVIPKVQLGPRTIRYDPREIARWQLDREVR